MKMKFQEEINLITLKIKDCKLEESYKVDVGKSVEWYRIAIVLGLSMYMIFYVVDYNIYKSLLFDFLKIRIFFVTPIVVISFMLTFWKKYGRYSQLINFFTITASGIGIIMMGIVGKDHPEISRAYSGLVPLFIYIYAFLRMNYLKATLAGTSLLLGYSLVEIFIIKTPINISIANFFYMAASNTAGIFVAYLLEYQGKVGFLLQNKLQQLSIMDPMTGLNNRYYFNTVCEKDIFNFLKSKDYPDEKRNNKTDNNYYGLMIADIDYFKTINDTYGHNFGDTVIIEIANKLKENIRETDEIIRWGGEEFLIILKNIINSSMDSIVKEIGGSIQDSIIKTKNNKKINVSCSIGYIEIPLPIKVENVEDIINYADKALYLAKENGRNKAYKATFKNGSLDFIGVNW